MLLTYVDESYDANHYWMVALLVSEQHLRPLGRALDAVVRKAAESYPVAESAELHGHALVQAKDDWSRMGTKGSNMVRARIGIFKDAMTAIAEHDVRVVVRGLDRQEYEARGAVPCPPHELVLRHLLEQIDHLVHGEDQLTLVIADEIDGADGHRQHFRDYQQGGTGGTLSSMLPRIVDTIHFAPSKASRLLQAADLIAYLHRRLTSAQDKNPRARAANEMLWSSIAPSVVHSHCWKP